MFDKPLCSNYNGYNEVSLMNNNIRFPVGVHILSLIALNKKNTNTSELLARSVNTNPVVIRRLLSQLKQAGLVKVNAGIGGAELQRASHEITLLDVYKAVNPNWGGDFFLLHENPNQQCYVGRNIVDALEMPLVKVNEAMAVNLAATTIADIAAFINSRQAKAQG